MNLELFVGVTCGDMMAHVEIWWVHYDFSVSSGPLNLSLEVQFLYRKENLLIVDGT